MKQNKVFKSADGKCKIAFDDWIDERKEYGSWWVGMCSKCFANHKKYLKNKADDYGSGCCSVKNCNNNADYYIDFKSNELIDDNE